MLPAGSLPASALPSRMLATGMASAASAANPSTAIRAGRRCTNRAQRVQAPGPLLTERRRPIRHRFTLCPAKPSSAGSRVTAASTATATASDDPRANPLRNDRPMSNMPSSEMTTVHPANTTARPAVLIASTTAACGSPRRASASRYRVTMSKA